MQTKLLIDLDNVLADFVRGAIDHYKRVDIYYDEIIWQLETHNFGMKQKDFWDGLGYDFWANLKWTPEGVELLDKLLSITDYKNMAVCTAPSKVAGCVQGKIDWMQRHLPRGLQDNYIITTKKHFAAQGNLLIDDNNENCDSFMVNGGQAILTPRPWNRRASEMIGMDFDIDQIVREVKEAWDR